MMIARATKHKARLHGYMSVRQCRAVQERFTLNAGEGRNVRQLVISVALWMGRYHYLAPDAHFMDVNTYVNMAQRREIFGGVSLAQRVSNDDTDLATAGALHRLHAHLLSLLLQCVY